MLRLLVILTAVTLFGCHVRTKAISGGEDIFRLWKSDKFGCKGYRQNEAVDSLIQSMSERELLQSLGKPNSKFSDAEHQTEAYHYLTGSSSCGDCILRGSKKRFECGGMILEVSLKKDSNDVLRVIYTGRSIIN